MPWRAACFLVPAALALACAGGGPPPVVVPPPPILEQVPIVRVGLLVQVEDVQLGSTGTYAMSDNDGVLVVGSDSDVFSVRREGNRLVVYTPGGDLVETVVGKLTVETRSPNEHVTVNGARYPRRADVVLDREGGLTVINVLDVETYLRGVIPLEIGHRQAGMLEAAKAQAVAARTYVAAHLGQYPDQGFDLHAGVRDQVYGPVDRRHPNADRAVWETRGMILEYQGQPIRANYASTCGGRTAGVEESFDADPIPYLRSHEDKVNGKYACERSRFFRWEESWNGDELKAVLVRTLPQVLGRPFEGVGIRDLEAVDTGKSGRIVTLRITTDQAVYDLHKSQIRWALETTGGTPLRSTAFTIQTWKRGQWIRMLVTQGRGWGHGVGMCQWGAMQMSLDGYDYRRILEHYYPGTQLRPWFPSEALSRNRVETDDGNG
jgi:stage II sporulation protein D